jgi:YD repeat-containing protein
MADDLSTDPAALSERLNQLRDQVRASYQAGRLSADTARLIAAYVDAAVQSGLDVSASDTSEQVLVADLTNSLNLGLSDPAVFTAVEQQVADLRAGRHLAGGSPPQRHVELKVDPVEMFSGQFTLQVTDVSIDGAGIDFVFRRSYKSQAVYFGPLGANWDHSYNLYLRERGPDLLRSSGDLREDTYTRHPLFGQTGFNYWVPPDGRHAVIQEDGPSFVWRTPAGARHRYEPDTADPTFHRVREITDRYGNTLLFTYRDQRLWRVEINRPERLVVLDSDELGRITAVTDYTGRTWRYEYDDFGDLVAVTGPGTARYRAGLTTSYEYSSSSHSAPLQHNLERIIDPAGQLFLENEYGVDGGLLAFNRLVRQRQGGGESFFEYETVLADNDDLTETERPAIQVNQVQRNGHPVHLVYNALGNLLLQEEYACIGGLQQLTSWRTWYNRDGAVIATLSPEGTMSQFYYGRDDYLRFHGIEDRDVATDDALTHTDRLAFGNLLASVRRGRRYDLALMTAGRSPFQAVYPDVLSGLDPNDIVVKYSYEPDFQQVAAVSDPRYTTSADPRHAEPTNYARHLVQYQYSATGALTRILYPDTTFPAPLPNGVAGLINIADEYLQYDAHGRLEVARDPEGNTTEKRYYQPGPATSPVKDGYLRQVESDSAGLGLTVQYDVNEVGVVTGVVNARGFRTDYLVNELNQVTEAHTAGPGYHTRYRFNRNGLIERQERDNLDESRQPSADGDEVTTYRYDEQHNLIRHTWGGDNLVHHHVVRHGYNESDQRILTVRPGGGRLRIDYDERLLQRSVVRAPTTADASTTRTQYDADRRTIATVDGQDNRTRRAYDTFDRLTSVIDPLGNVVQTEYDKRGNTTITRVFEPAPGGHKLLKRRAFEYDERDNLVRETAYQFDFPILTVDIDNDPDKEFRAALTAGQVREAQTLSYFDRNRRLFRRVNALGQEWTYEYDGVNRRTLERDPLGNYTTYSHDGNSNVVRVDRHEIVRDPQTGNPMGEEVFSTISEYDELDRLVSSTDTLGNVTRYGYNSRNNLTIVTDPLGNVLRSTYDVFGRKIEHVVQQTDDGLGSGTPLPPLVSRFEYDDNDNLVAVTDANGSATTFVYDNLDRAAQTVYSDGSTRTTRYDRDDNVIAEIDNNGLRVNHEVDPLKRRTHSDLDTSLLDPRFPYPADAETFEDLRYDGAGRLIRHANDFVTVTSQFDSFDGCWDEQVNYSTPVAAPVGPLPIRRRFDLLGNRTQLTLPSGRSTEYAYDDLNRLTSIRNVANGADYPGSGTLGPQYPIATFTYRGLRLWLASFGNNTGYEQAFDGNGRTISVSHHDNSGAVVDLQRLYDASGNLRLRLDAISPGVPASAERYWYDSSARLTHVATATVNPRRRHATGTHHHRPRPRRPNRAGRHRHPPAAARAPAGHRHLRVRRGRQPTRGERRWRRDHLYRERPQRIRHRGRGSPRVRHQRQHAVRRTKAVYL